MKLVSYLKEEHDQLAILENNLLYDTDLLHMEMPSSMMMFLTYWEDNYSLALKLHQAILDKRIGKEKGFPVDEANRHQTKDHLQARLTGRVHLLNKKLTSSAKFFSCNFME